MRILLVEDDPKLVMALQKILIDADYQVTAVSDGNTAYNEASSAPYDVILMDWLLPGMNGVDVIRKLRADGNDAAIIVITALGEIGNRVEGLDAGADDYIPKPFYPKELLARIKAITRRQVPNKTTDGLFHFGDLSFDEEHSILSKDNTNRELSPKESAIMALFMAHPNTPLSKEKIKIQVWGDEEHITDNNIEAYVSMLRRIMEELDSCVEIKTFRRVGYQLTNTNTLQA